VVSYNHPSTDYSVSGTNIVFTTAPESSLSFSGISLGPAVPVDYANNGNVYTRNTFIATASQTHSQSLVHILLDT
jgi:hypothetical protein